MERLSMKEIRKALQRNEIRLSKHVFEDRMKKRGYTKKDFLNCIWTGERTELQFRRGQYKAVVEGLDSDGLPIVIVVTVDQKNPKYLIVLTSFPPIKDKYKRVI